MRIIFVSNYSKDQDAREKIADALQSVVTYTGVETLGGLFFFNSAWHSQDDDEIQFGIDMKDFAKSRGMYFYQPLWGATGDTLMEEVRVQVARKQWDGNYLLVPAGWRFTAQVDVRKIEELIAGEQRVLLPFEHEGGVKVGGFDSPYFGTVENLLEGSSDYTKNVAHMNGDPMIAVCERFS